MSRTRRRGRSRGRWRRTKSAAPGIPDPSVDFSRILEVMLRERYPDRTFEVVNTGIVAINSHVILPIARRAPDLFVILMGNNEVVGPFGASGVLGPSAPGLGLGPGVAAREDHADRPALR